MSANLADDPQTNNIIGASVPRIEGPEKATGRAVYTDDITRPGMLHAALLGSHYAHARILSIDTSRARALAGVKAVLTGTDLPLNYIGMFIKDQLPLATDTVRYAGEPVAAVAAVDLKTARHALQLIEVEYEELEPVFDVIKALEPGAPVIHEKRDEYPTMYELPQEPNAICFTEFMEGDPNAVWDQCDAIVEDEYRVPAQYHAYMEPSSTVAEMDGNGKITLWSSTQGVARSQMYTAMATGLPMSKIRVIAPRIGGGFGGKCEFTNQPITALLARATGRPVKLTYSREDDMTMMKRRHGGVIFMKTGAAKDGTLLARDCRIVLDGGAYADESPEVSPVAAFFSRGPYRIPNMRVEAWSVYTNLSRASAFRGFGNPQATFASESQLDQLAEKLDMDPLELRIRNALGQDDKFFCGKTIESGHHARLPGEGQGRIRLEGKAERRSAGPARQTARHRHGRHNPYLGPGGRGGERVAERRRQRLAELRRRGCRPGVGHDLYPDRGRLPGIEHGPGQFCRAGYGFIPFPVPDRGEPQHLRDRQRGETGQRRRPGTDLPSCR